MKGRSVRNHRLPALLTLSLLLLGGSSVAQGQEITGDHRWMELDNFLQDGELIRSTWLELRGDYGDWGSGGTDSRVRGIATFAVANRMEFGGTFGYLDRSRSEDQELFGERLAADLSNNGPDDVDVFAKLQLKKGPHSWAAGLLVKFPTADDGELLGSGAADYGLFVANRRTRTRSALLWNADVRFNGDPKPSGTGSGKTSAALGGGFLLKLSYSWTFLAEARYESRRYDGGDVDFRITPTIDFRPTENLALRLGVDIGLADGAPHENYTFGFVFHL